MDLAPDLSYITAIDHYIGSSEVRPLRTIIVHQKCPEEGDSVSTLWRMRMSELNISCETSRR